MNYRRGTTDSIDLRDPDTVLMFFVQNENGQDAMSKFS